MKLKQLCPICRSDMFHDKGNHITFCAQCDHVGWPHDAPLASVAGEHVNTTDTENLKKPDERKG